MREWNDIAVLAPPGDIDISSVPELRDEVDALLARGVRRIIINCQRVTFIDSTGLAFLLSRARRLISHNGLLSLVGVTRDVARFIQIAHLSEALHVTPADRPPVPVLAPGETPLWSRAITVKEGVEHLGLYRHRVIEMLQGLDLSRDAIYDTALAAGEALGNAYDHAGGAHCVINVSAYRDRVVIEVRDEGRGFEIAPDEEPEATDERGRGIRLMRMLVDSVEVRKRSDGPGTVVRLIKVTGEGVSS